MTAKARPQDPPVDLNREERRRRNAAIEQSWRVREYFPVLERRIAELEAELRETRDHLEAERRAFEDLAFESLNSPDVIANYYQKRAENAA